MLDLGSAGRAGRQGGQQACLLDVARSTCGSQTADSSWLGARRFEWQPLQRLSRQFLFPSLGLREGGGTQVIFLCSLDLISEAEGRASSLHWNCYPKWVSSHLLRTADRRLGSQRGKGKWKWRILGLSCLFILSYFIFTTTQWYMDWYYPLFYSWDINSAIYWDI